MCIRDSGYSERDRRSDIVLDVDAIAAKAPKLGRSVTLVRIADGFHDLTSVSYTHLDVYKRQDSGRRGVRPAPADQGRQR